MPSTETTEGLFDDWALRGRAEGMERGHEARALQALEAMPIALGEKLLDLGCGNGWASRWLSRKTGSFGFVAGVDLSSEMIARAKEVSGTRYGVQFRQTSFTDLPWSDGFFDHGFSMEALYYAEDLGAALASVGRVLRPGGTLTICVDFYEENPHCLGWPEMMGIPMVLLSEDGWSDALETAGFQVQQRWRCLDPRPVDPSLPDDERRAEENFRTEVGSLAIRGVRAL
ncbi:MAG TPA: SAM-dependent methyltransferase [Deltaproteobacteria bacterium]|nr:SAM-dependent methyltransferase [Deltaproteobacteria bacterium]